MNRYTKILQQQLEDDPKKETGHCAFSTESKHTVEVITDRKPAPKKSSSDPRRQPVKKPAAKPAPKRGDGLSHRLVKRGNQRSACFRLRYKPKLNQRGSSKTNVDNLIFHQIQQMISQDVSLQNMDFQDEDIQRAVSLYENLNATAVTIRPHCALYPRQIGTNK